MGRRDGVAGWGAGVGGVSPRPGHGQAADRRRRSWEASDMRPGILAVGEFLPSAIAMLEQDCSVHHFVDAPRNLADAIGTAAAASVRGIMMEPNRSVTR